MATATGGNGHTGGGGGGEAVANAIAGALHVQQIIGAAGNTPAVANARASQNLTSGTLPATNISIGTTTMPGTVNQSGTVVVTATNSFTVTAGSTYNLLGGSLTTPLLIVDGNFNWYAGSLTINALEMDAVGGVLTGTVNLTTNPLIIHSGPNPSELATVWSYLASGYNGGTWTGTGINSSTVASDTTHFTALGIIVNDDGTHTGTPLYPVFEGITSGDGDLLIKRTYYGDADLDGKVDGSDYSRIDNGYLNHLTGWFNGDFNYDGVVNGSDYTLIDNAFNSQGAQLLNAIATPTNTVAGSAPVPEPATITIAMIGTLGLLSRHRKP